MVWYVDCLYIIELIDQSYNNQERKCNFCSKLNCTFCQISADLEKQLRDIGFNTKYSNQKVWFVSYIFHEKRITTFPVLKNEWKIEI